MAESTLPNEYEHLDVVAERQSAAGAGSVSLQQGHFIKVTFYRFYDWRKAAVDGLTQGESQAFMEGNVSPAAVRNVALPMHSNTNMSSTDTSARAWNGQDVIPARVYTMHPADQLIAPGAAGRTELVGTVTRLTTSKRLDSAAGTFTMDSKVFGEWVGADEPIMGNGGLGSDNSIHKYVDAGDWVEINVVSSDERTTAMGESERTIMVGKVDGVSIRSSTSGSGGTNTTVTIRGRDGGSVFEDTSLYFNPYDPGFNNPVGVDMATMIHDIGGSPTEMVKELLGLVSNPTAIYGMTPVVPDGGLWFDGVETAVEFGDVVNSDTMHPTRGVYFDPGLLSPGQYTPLWQFVQSYGNPQMNEVWVDTDPTKIGPNNHPQSAPRRLHVIMREKPFVNVFDGEDSPWFDMEARAVNLKEVKNVTLSRGTDRYNHMTLLVEMPATMNQDVFAICKPTVNFHSVKRYGLKKLEVSLPIYSQYEGKDHASLVAELAEWRDMFVSWNVLNPYYWEGTFTIAGIRGDLQVGQKVVVEGGPLPNFPDGPLTPVGDGYVRNPSWNDLAGVVSHSVPGTSTTFYIESVSHSWGAGLSPTAETTIVVSRGYPEADRLKHIRALYGLWSDTTDPALANVARPQATNIWGNTGAAGGLNSSVRDGVIT